MDTVNLPPKLNNKANAEVFNKTLRQNKSGDTKKDGNNVNQMTMTQFMKALGQHSNTNNNKGQGKEGQKKKKDNVHGGNPTEGACYQYGSTRRKKNHQKQMMS
jgi:hypothetical protein